MKRPSEGRIHERITAIGSRSFPGYVVEGDELTLMIDCGLSFLGPRYLSGLTETLGEASRLDLLFLTHSHYDHLGAASYLKRHLPGLKIGAHERVPALLQKESALAVMNQLSQSHAAAFSSSTAGGNAQDVPIEPFPIDMVLKHGDQYDLGGLTCHVYETPGHTRDSLTFHFPEIATVFPGDACGAFKNRAATDIQVQFVSSFQAYVDSIRFIMTLRPRLLCLAHSWVLEGDDVDEYLNRTLAETLRYREMIENYLDAAGGDVEEAIRRITHDDYDTRADVVQMRDSYIANLSAQVRHLAELRAPTKKGAAGTS